MFSLKCFVAAITVAFLVVSSRTSCIAQQAQASQPNPFTFSSEALVLDFHWQGDSVNNKWEPYTALLIPVKLPNCPKQFYMQFDLGSPFTLFYNDQVQQIRSRYPRAILLNDSGTSVQNATLRIGDQTLKADQLGVRKLNGAQINWTSTSINVIGTIGADLIDKKIILIDYPNKTMIVGSAIPESIKPGLKLTDFIYMRNSILFPAVIRGKKTILYFDTGSSAYQLLTSKEASMELTVAGATPVQYKVRSWDKLLTANTLPTNDSVELANMTIPIREVTYMEGVSESQVQQMMKMGIGGMTGNKLFLHSVLVIDVKNRKFGIKQ